MRFNSKEIFAVANQPSHKFDKEGILFIKEKQDSLFKRSEVYSQRWCRLRGNLLFYCKTKEQYSEPIGVYILEECSVRLDQSSEIQNAFSLVFLHDEQGQQFGAISESERDSWIQALHMASMEYMRLQLSSLKEKLKEKHASTKNSIEELPILKKPKSFSVGANYYTHEYEAFLEISLNCDNLMCDGDGQPPNPIVCISVNNLPSVKWTKYSQTEIIEKSSNPCFLTTVSLCKSDVNEQSRIKLSAYDVKERLTCTTTLLGESVFTLATLIQSPSQAIRLTLVSPSFSSVGFITIRAGQMTESKQKNAWLLLAEEESLWSKIERPRVYSLPSRLTSENEMPVLGLLKSLACNFTTQTYRFHTGLGAELHVNEIMSESKLSFTIPCMLLDLWIDEEKKLLDTIFQINELTPEWHQKYLAATDCHLCLINHYTEAVDFLLKQKGMSFKKSSKKKDTNFEFVPVNLHVQRMRVQNVTTRKTGVYDVITVGAFAAMPLRFAHGGLLRQLNESRKHYPVASENSCGILGSDPISCAAEAILRIEHLQEELEEDIQKLTTFRDTNFQDVTQSVLNILSTKSDQLTHICSSQVVNEALSFMDSLNAEKASKVPNQDLHSTLSLNFRSRNEVTDLLRSEHFAQTTKSNSSSFVSEVSYSSLKSLHKSAEDTVNKAQSSTFSSTLKNIIEQSNQNSELMKSPDEVEPLDLTHLNIKASIMCLTSKLQGCIQSQEKINDVIQSSSTFNEWTEDLMPSIKKLRQAIHCLLKTAKLTYSMISLKESSKAQGLSQKMRHRRDVVFSQALTALVTGLLVRLWCRQPDPMFVYMLRTVGVLCHFEGLLSCYGDEMGKIEDMIVGIDDLRRVLFYLEPSSTFSNPQPRITGSRLFLCVFLPAPQSVISLLPAEFSKGFRFTVTSVFFNIGINELATLAEKFGDTSLQEKINQDSLYLLKEHFLKFQSTAKGQKNYGFHFAETHIVDLLEQVQNQICLKKSKNVEILHLTSEICKHLGGIRFTSCKSAKDRTSMSVTLEQAMVLLKDFHLDERELSRVLECMRSEGTRRENTFKNTGVRKYHFTSLQLMSLPKLYRPPTGTFGNVEP